MSEDAHDSNFVPSPDQIAQPLQPTEPEFSPEDLEFLRTHCIRLEKK